MPKSITMTASEVCQELRLRGIPTTATKVIDGIESGAYPFGRISHVGEHGRRRVEIFRVDFDAWIKSKVPKEEPT